MNLEARRHPTEMNDYCSLSVKIQINTEMKAWKAVLGLLLSMNSASETGRNFVADWLSRWSGNPVA